MIYPASKYKYSIERAFIFELCTSKKGQDAQPSKYGFCYGTQVRSSHAKCLDSCQTVSPTFLPKM